MQIHRWGCLAVVAAVSLVGCGGGDDRLTKDQFIEQGNQICERTQQRVGAAADRTFTAEGEIPSAEQITAFANDTLDPALEEELNRLRELTPPQADEERIEDILDAGQSGLEEIRRDPTSLIGDRDPLENYNELASGYGLDKCGNFGEDVDRALAGLGPGGPVRGGDTGATGDTGTVEPADPGAGETEDPVDPTETTDTTG